MSLRNPTFGVFELCAASKRPKPLQFRLLDENSYRQLKRARAGRQKNNSRVIRHSIILQEHSHGTSNGQSYLPTRQDSAVGLPNQTIGAISPEIVACESHLLGESLFDVACLATQRPYQAPHEVHTSAHTGQDTPAILDIVCGISRDHSSGSSAGTKSSLTDADVECAAEMNASSHQLKEPSVELLAGVSTLDTLDGDDVPAGATSNFHFSTTSNKVAQTSSATAERVRQASFANAKCCKDPVGSAELPQTVSTGRQTRSDELLFWTSQRDEDLLHFRDIVQLEWHEIEAYFPGISKTQVLSRYHYLHRREKLPRSGTVLRLRAVSNRMTEISLGKPNKPKPSTRSRAHRSSARCSIMKRTPKITVTSVPLKEQDRDSTSNITPLRTSRSGRHIRAPPRRPDEGYQMPRLCY